MPPRGPPSTSSTSIAGGISTEDNCRGPLNEVQVCTIGWKACCTCQLFRQFRRSARCYHLRRRSSTLTGTHSLTELTSHTREAVLSTLSIVSTRSAIPQYPEDSK